MYCTLHFVPILLVSYPGKPVWGEPTAELLPKISVETSVKPQTNNHTLQCGHIFEKMISGIEFPQINYRKYNTKKYRYVYGVGWHSKADIIHTVSKFFL